MVVKEFFALLGMRVDDASFGRANTALSNINVGLLAVAGAAVASISAIVRTSASYEQLKVSLVTATKSVAGAEAAFADLQVFADNTPFTLEQATKAYIRMASAGLKPTIEALTDFGDIASAIPGKSILDFVEAVADGTQGEAKRLKEFGIGLRKQGSQVELTFGGIKTKVKNDAQSIEDGIRAISKLNFGGSMERQSQTLLGMWSTLSDKASGLAFDIGEGGLLPSLKGAVAGLTKLLTAVRPVAKVFGSALNIAIKTVSRAFAPLGLVIEWVGKKLSGLGGALSNGVIIFAVNTLAGAFVLLGISAVRAGTATLLSWLAALAPFVAMAALVGAILLILEDIYVWLMGGESVLGDLLGTWDEFWKKLTTVNPDDPWWLKAIKEGLKKAEELIELLRKLDPERFAAEALNKTGAGIGAFNSTLGSINEGFAATGKENRRKKGKLTAEEKMQELMKASEWVAEQTGLPDVVKERQKAWFQGTISALSQGSINGSSVAGANAITNANTTNKATNQQLNVTVNGANGTAEFEQALKEHLPAWFGGVLGETKGSVK